MAYDESIAERLRDALATEPDVIEKKMFGGLAMLVNGNMAVGVYGDGLLVRTDPSRQDEFLAEPGARMFDMVASRPMKGWIVVDGEHCADDRDFRRWVKRGVAYSHTFPAK